jgi:hypothetical protein
MYPRSGLLEQIAAVADSESQNLDFVAGIELVVVALEVVVAAVLDELENDHLDNRSAATAEIRALLETPSAGAAESSADAGQESLSAGRLNHLPQSLQAAATRGFAVGTVGFGAEVGGSAAEMEAGNQSVKDIGIQAGIAPTVTWW